MHNNRSKFTFGDIVYIVTDPEQSKRMVTELRFSTGQVLYKVAHNGFDTECYEFELSDKVDQSIKLGLESES
jgi:hypothetical protein